MNIGISFEDIQPDDDRLDVRPFQVSSGSSQILEEYFTPNEAEEETSTQALTHLLLTQPNFLVHKLRYPLQSGESGVASKALALNSVLVLGLMSNYQPSVDSYVSENESETWIRVSNVLSPFDVLAEEEDAELRAAIARLQKDLTGQKARELHERLLALLTMGYEDDPEETPIRPDSVSALTDFLVAMPEVRKPSIVVTPMRNIQAQWGKARDAKLVIEFLPDRTAKFVLFSKDVDRERINRVSGHVTIGNLARRLRVPNEAPWLFSK